MNDWSNTLVVFLVILIQSGIFVRLYIVARNKLVTTHPDSELIKTLTIIADQVVQSVEQTLDNKDGTQKYLSALSKFTTLAKDHGMDLPTPEILEVYIEAAVKRLDNIPAIAADPIIVAKKHISGRPPQ